MEEANAYWWDLTWRNLKKILAFYSLVWYTILANGSRSFFYA